MTSDDVKIKIYLILKIVFSSCMFALKHDTEERSIPDKLKYWKKHHSEYWRWTLHEKNW